MKIYFQEIVCQNLKKTKTNHQNGGDTVQWTNTEGFKLLSLNLNHLFTISVHAEYAF